jgi:hypothetical protein
MKESLMGVERKCSQLVDPISFGIHWVRARKVLTPVSKSRSLGTQAVGTLVTKFNDLILSSQLWVFFPAAIANSVLQESRRRPVVTGAMPNLIHWFFLCVVSPQ